MEFLVNKVHISATDVLYGVTGLAAEAIGRADCVGTLEPGKLANVIIVDGDPLTNMAAMRRVHTVIKDGEVLVHDGAMVWPDSNSCGAPPVYWEVLYDTYSNRHPSSSRHSQSKPKDVKAK